MKKKKYRLTYEVVIDVEADDVDEAIKKGDETWSKGEFELIPYIEELD